MADAGRAGKSMGIRTPLGARVFDSLPWGQLQFTHQHRRLVHVPVYNIHLNKHKTGHSSSPCAHDVPGTALSSLHKSLWLHPLPSPQPHVWVGGGAQSRQGRSLQTAVGPLLLGDVQSNSVSASPGSVTQLSGVSPFMLAWEICRLGAFRVGDPHLG